MAAAEGSGASDGASASGGGTRRARALVRPRPAPAPDPKDSDDRSLRPLHLKRRRREDRANLVAGQRIAFVLDNLEYPVNVGSLFRIADACGVEQVALCGRTPQPNAGQSFDRAARGKDRTVPWRHFAHTADALAALAKEGFVAVAVELSGRAVAYHEAQLPGACALVLGHEEHGVSRAALEQCPHHVYVPMLGDGGSLNVHVAAAVVAFRLRYPASPLRMPST